MPREIKFRAWLKDEKRMITKISSIKLDINCIYYDNNQLSSYERATFNDIELMQYTGLKDKNGVEIYEGDVVLAGSYYEIIWSESTCSFKMCNLDDEIELTRIDSNYIKVIGNIYENPELLSESLKFIKYGEAIAKGLKDGIKEGDDS